MIVKIPHYVKAFKCIGGECVDSCCVGWDVDVDKKTFEKYKNVNHTHMQRELKRYVHTKKSAYDNTIDYAYIDLDDDKRCRFLNADGWCMIQKHLGESYLSNICTLYPRIIHRLNNVYVMTLNPSCPEAIRLMTQDADALTMTHVTLEELPHILTFDINEKAKSVRGTPLSQLSFISDKVFSLMLDRENPIRTRILQIGEFLYGFEHKKKAFQSQFQYDAALSFGEDMIALLNKGPQMASLSYTQYTQKCSNVKGFHYMEGFLREYPHVIPNYFANVFLKNVFPFSEQMRLWDSFLLLVVRWCIIQTQLEALAENHDRLTLDMVNAYLQSFSKAFEHHRTYCDEAISTIYKKGYHKPEKVLQVI